MSTEVRVHPKHVGMGSSSKTAGMSRKSYGIN